jgi:hypothetical protein
MYRKDTLLTEIEKLALVLARLLGFKADGKEDEFTHLAENTMLKEYNLPLTELHSLTLEEFEVWLSEEKHSADKLDALAQLLYLDSEPFVASGEILLSLQKILFIFDLLEQKHHRQSFENISKRNHIYQFLENNYEP